MYKEAVRLYGEDAVRGRSLIRQRGVVRIMVWAKRYNLLNGGACVSQA